MLRLWSASRSAGCGGFQLAVYLSHFPSKGSASLVFVVIFVASNTLAVLFGLPHCLLQQRVAQMTFPSSWLSAVTGICCNP